MSGYQEFAPGTGHSRSAAKLAALMLPRLAGSTVLDVGCNEGFFCGFALARGASRVVGVDRDAASVDAARARFPGCEFLASDCSAAPPGPFDVVLLLSALHYMPDQEAAIHALMGRVGRGGVLVLELGIAEAPATAWVPVARADGVMTYPTRAKLDAILSPYAYKVIGRSVMQQGDPVPRWVVHVRHKMPMALLLPSASFTGKSTFARALAGHGIPTWSIDAALPGLVANASGCRLGRLLAVLAADLDPLVDCGQIVGMVFAAGLGVELILVIIGGDLPPLFVVEGTLPAEAIPQLRAALLAEGVATWVGDTPFPGGPPPLENTAELLVTVGGSTAFLSDGAVEGRIDAIDVSGSNLRISGWAVDRSAPACPALGFAVRVCGGTRPSRSHAIERADLVSAGIVPGDVAAGFALEVALAEGDAERIAAGGAVEVLALAPGHRATVIRPG